MGAVMAAKGPITDPGLKWVEQEDRRWENRLRSWEGVKISAESDLTEEEIKLLRDHGFLG